MKTILQKRTSKFVANLLNGLGIVACVSLTACDNKGKQTDAQAENLAVKLENNDFYSALAGDKESSKKISDWLKKNGKNEKYNVTNKDLDKIFPGSSSKFRVVNGRLVKNQKDCIKIEWNESSGYKLNGSEDFVTIEKLETLENLIKDLENKNVTVVGEYKFKLEFNEKNVKICGGENIDFTDDGIFERLIKSIVVLKSKGVIDKNFKINIVISENNVTLEGSEVPDTFMTGETFWSVIHDNVDLFSDLPFPKDFLLMGRSTFCL